MYKFLFTLTCALVSCVGLGQITPLSRTELNFERDFYISDVYNCHEHGVVVSTTDNPKRAERDPDRLFILYDTNLIETGSLKIEVPFRQKISNGFASKHVLYTLYYDPRFGDYSIVGIDPALESEQRFTGKIKAKIEEKGFMVYNGFAVLVNNSKRLHEIVIIELSTGQHHIVPLKQSIHRSAVEITDLRVFDNETELGIMYREYNRYNSETHLIVLNQNGNKSQVLDIGTDKHRVVKATSNRLQNGSLVVSGTYTDYNANSAQGMFVSLYDDEGQAYFSVRPFSDFNNFFGYMSDRGQQQMQRKKERHNERGRALNINVLMLIHPVQTFGRELVVMGEVYYPTYRTVNTTTYVNGRPVSTSTQVFDGYQYSHAAMVRFDMDGQYLNDYCFPISLWKKPYTLNKIVQMQNTDSTIKLAYMNFNTIKSSVITRSNQKDRTLNLQAGDDEQIRYTSADIEHWFGNIFLSKGYQNLKSHGNDQSRKKRDVFYMQKVEIR